MGFTIRILAVLTVLFVTLLVAIGPTGCAPSAQQRSSTIIYGSPYQPNSLNPISAPDLVSRSIVELIFDGLVSANDRLELRGELATSWDTSPDGLLWTFALRKDVRWHDGRAFTGDDVKFTYDTVLDPNSKPTVSKGDYAAIKRVETVDPHTVRFYLSRPDAAFLSRLVLGIAPKHLLQGQDLATTAFTHKPVGTGPFVFESWRQGESIVLRRNSGYFGTVPRVERLIWKVVPDGNALSLQVLGGDVDAAPILNARDASVVRDAARMATVDTLEGNTQVSLQLKNPLFQDPRVRQALAHGIDTRTLIDRIMLGEATPASSDILPTSWAYNPGVAAYRYDPSMAKQLLAEAGWKPDVDGILTRDGRRFELTLMTDAGHKGREHVMLAVRQNWADLGLDVKASLQERNSFVSQRVLKGDFDAVLLQSAVQIDPDLSRRFHSSSIGNGQNFLNYRNPRVDTLLEQALSTTDQAQRRTAYFEIQSIMAEELPQISLFHPKSIYAFRRGLEGVRPSPASLFWNAEEWGWK